MRKILIAAQWETYRKDNHSPLEKHCNFGHLTLVHQNKLEPTLQQIEDIKTNALFRLGFCIRQASLVTLYSVFICQ